MQYGISSGYGWRRWLPDMDIQTHITVRELITMNVHREGLAKANNSQNPAGYNMRSPILWDVAPHLTRTGTQLNEC